jgi:DNA-binding MarR family transcriptional regulator
VTQEEPGFALVHLLRALTVEFDLAAAEFARLHGLHPTDLRALIALLDAGRAGIEPTPGWLGAQLNLNSASVTALADRLERLGHVRRERDTGDRRRVLLRVTADATALGWSFFGPLIGRIVGAAGTFTTTEIATTERVLRAIMAAAGDKRH